MMGRSLLIAGVLGTVGVMVAAGLGYGLSSPADAGMRTHVVAALVALLLLMFSHSWILLYLLATGKMIRDAVREGGLDPEPLAVSRSLRRICYPVILAAALLTIATFLVGGAVAARAASPWVHQTLFWSALAVQGAALWFEWKGLAVNERVLVDVDQRLAMVPA
jgi:hypothetical protein